MRGTPSAVSFQPDHMRQMATTEGSATKSESGVSAAAKNSGAAAVPSEAPTSGAEHSAAVSVLVTRVPPMRREKAAVNGAMNKICALSPSISPATSRHSVSGGAA